ncbi:MAG: hypothetical protein K2M43_02415 [Mycoplasmoidaceae bacterium]|nr:hypothetical protein [Mycoplasmoidaceae bacterium]
MSPNQVDVIPVDPNKHFKYAQKITNALRKQGFRVYFDNSDERLSKKIFYAQTHKIPYQIIIGDNEVLDKNISYREYGKQDSNTIKLNQFVRILKKRIKDKN